MLATRSVSLVLAAGTLGLLAGCGSSSSGGSTTPVNPNQADVSPAGDIPDNQAYVPYRPPGGGYTVKVPEGWARSAQGGVVTFTDKLNSVQIESLQASSPSTSASARRADLRRLAASVKGFSAPHVSTVSRPAGKAVLITY